MIEPMPKEKKSTSTSLKSSLAFLRRVEERATLLWEKSNNSDKSVMDYFLEAQRQLKEEGLI